MKFYLFLMIFLLVGAFFIISNNNLHMGKQVEMDKFLSLYYSWFGSLFDNAKSLTAYAIKSEWLPEKGVTKIVNNSNSTK
jgi:hypothetical protein